MKIIQKILSVVAALALVFISTMPVLAAGTEKIVFIRQVDGAGHIFTMDVDGSNQVDLTPDAEGSYEDVEVSPDGTKLAFVYEEGDDKSLGVMNSDGSGFDLLKDYDAATSSFLGLSWSPDGSQLVFSQSSGDLAMYKIDSDGQNLEELTDGAQFPSWSPDGSQIAFRTDSGIMVMDSDGTNEEQLSNNPADDHPVWSPDGSKVAFTRITGMFLKEINIMDSDGSNEITVVPGDANNGTPDWSPDGSQLVFSSNDTAGGNFAIFVADAEEAGTVSGLTDNDSSQDQKPDWAELNDAATPTALPNTGTTGVLISVIALSGIMMAFGGYLAHRHRLAPNNKPRFI